MSMTITNIDNSNVILKDGKFKDDTLTAAGALELKDGTILARITATGKLAVYASGAADGTEIPLAVLTYDKSIAGAGDVAVRPLIAGEVKKQLLIEQGKLPGVDITDAVCDKLRHFSIVPQDITELNIYDNA